MVSKRTSRRRTTSSSDNLRGSPTGQPVPHRRRITLPLIVGASLAAAIALVVWTVGSVDAPPPVLPNRAEELAPPVRRLIETHIQAVREAPNKARTHGRLGLAYEANEMWDEAARSFAHAAELEPGEPSWVYHRAITVRLAGDFDASLELLRDLARRHADLAYVQHRLGHSLLEAGDISGASQAFERARALEPDAEHPLVGLAEIKLQEHDFEAARILLELALKLDPHYGAARYALGLALRGLGQKDAATKLLRGGLGASPRFMTDPLGKELEPLTANPSGLLSLATDQLAGGRVEASIRTLRRGLELYPNDFGVLNNLAAAYREHGDLDRAKLLFHKASTVDADHFAPLVNLALCCLDLGQAEQALVHAESAVRKAPTTGTTHAVLGRTLAALKRYEQAYYSLRRAIELGASGAELLLELGQVCARLERYGESKSYLLRAADLLPGSWQAHISLCVLYIQLRDLDAAAAALATAQAIAPDHPNVRLMTQRLAELQRE